MTTATTQAVSGREALAAERTRKIAGALQPHRVLLGVLALYALAAWVVPTMTPVAIGDDWVYARSVELLIEQGKLQILDLSVVTLVWQVLWGGLFGLVLGPTFGAMRLSSVVLTGIGGIALYGLCRELDISRGRSALGAALYLFNPLLFVLSYTFMSDAQFTALLTISAALYARGLRPDRSDWRWTLAGSFAAGCAFLERQQGALIPLAVCTYLVLDRRLRPDRRGTLLFAQTVALPAAMTVAYYLWFRFIHGIPKAQGDFLKRVTDAGIGGAGLLAARLAVIEAMYLGLFVLPLTVAALVALPRFARALRPAGWGLFCIWGALVVGGAGRFWQDGRRMPYVPHYFNLYGLGAYDLRGGRPWVLDLRALDVFTIVCGVSALVCGFILCQAARLGGPANERPARTPDRAGVGLLLTIALWQIIGVLPQSFTFREWTFRGLNAPSLDRYLLPILPFALGLVLWALRGVRIALPAAWVLAAVFALYAVVGTRDMLAFHGAVWDLARQLNREGVTNTRLDAGAAWDGYHLYEYSRATGSTTRIARPWWIGLFAPATDGSYVISGASEADDATAEEYEIIRQVEYSCWLDPRPTYLYVLRRRGLDGPP